MIRLRNISKRYTLGPVSLDVLRGVTLDVEAGDLLSIMGPSGCGKSTLLNILGLLDAPTGGSYLLKGREASSMSDDEASLIRNANIGFVFQSFHLLPRMTAAQNVGLPLLYRGVPERQVARRAVEELDRVGMSDRADHKPNQLSGGQQQRVALARALVGQPSVILADEPTGALDPQTGREIMDLFEELCGKHGMTIIIVTHAKEVEQRCARNCRMQDGVLIEEAAPPARAAANA